MTDPFAIKDCSLLALATARRAHNLRELGTHVADAHPGSLYYHFWGGRLRPRFDLPEFQNDFAAWARFALNDHPLSEKLGIIDPTAYPNLEALRRGLLDVIEERLDEREFVPWAHPGKEFVFIRSQIVVFDTRRRVTDPHELAVLIPQLPSSSLFYHFIDARRRRDDSQDDFRAWLTDLEGDYTPLIEDLATIDPYFTTLMTLRDRVTASFHAKLPPKTKLRKKPRKAKEAGNAS